MTFKMFKIMDIDGKFSTGGSYIRFTKNGKTWSTQSGLTNHITQVADINRYIGCTLITITENGSSSEHIEDFILNKLKSYYDLKLKDSTSKYDAPRKEAYEKEMKMLESIIIKRSNT
jgi:hypothetical protein